MLNMPQFCPRVIVSMTLKIYTKVLLFHRATQIQIPIAFSTKGCIRIAEPHIFDSTYHVQHAQCPHCAQQNLSFEYHRVQKNVYLMLMWSWSLIPVPPNLKQYLMVNFGSPKLKQYLMVNFGSLELL